MMLITTLEHMRKEINRDVKHELMSEKVKARAAVDLYWAAELKQGTWRGGRVVCVGSRTPLICVSGLCWPCGSGRCKAIAEDGPSASTHAPRGCADAGADSLQEEPSWCDQSQPRLRERSRYACDVPCLSARLLFTTSVVCSAMPVVCSAMPVNASRSARSSSSPSCDLRRRARLPPLTRRASLPGGETEALPVVQRRHAVQVCLDVRPQA